MSNIPTVQVPVDIFLNLVRLYKEQSQEQLDRGEYMATDQLERRAYRKLSAHLKQQKPAK